MGSQKMGVKQITRSIAATWIKMLLVLEVISLITQTIQASQTTRRYEPIATKRVWSVRSDWISALKEVNISRMRIASSFID
jgi:hypothetical protein